MILSPSSGWPSKIYSTPIQTCVDNSAGKPLRSLVQAPLMEFVFGPDKNIHHQPCAVKVKPQLLNLDSPKIIWKRNGRARKI